MVWSPKSIPENILQELWNSSDLDPPKKVDYYLSGNKSSENIIQKSIQCLTKEEVQVDDHCLTDSLQQTNANCLASEIEYKVNVPKKIKSKDRRYTRILKPVMVLGNSLRRSYRYAIKKLSNCGSKVCGLFCDCV
ncbi:uncharacterized protein LOC126901688 [Daktulosphaira vitifoliae]|nr:uncharacterized protein LOC126901688 [Daktulosphaira vitifoliae]